MEKFSFCRTWGIVQQQHEEIKERISRCADHMRGLIEGSTDATWVENFPLGAGVLPKTAGEFNHLGGLSPYGFKHSQFGTNLWFEETGVSEVGGYGFDLILPIYAHVGSGGTAKTDNIYLGRKALYVYQDFIDLDPDQFLKEGAGLLKEWCSQPTSKRVSWEQVCQSMPDGRNYLENPKGGRKTIWL